MNALTDMAMDFLIFPVLATQVDPGKLLPSSKGFGILQETMIFNEFVKLLTCRTQSTTYHLNNSKYN